MMKIRRAVLEDINFVFEVSNEQAVRKASFCPEGIKFCDHEKWFKDKIQNERVLFLIASEDNTPFGQIRYELADESAIISISLSVRYRGKHLGADFLRKSISFLKEKYPRIKEIQAWVREDNPVSSEFFLRNGFRLLGEDTVNGRKARFFDRAV